MRLVLLLSLAFASRGGLRVLQDDGGAPPDDGPPDDGTLFPI